MPFTPFHMGPGMLVKAGLQGSFSLLVFGWTQILIDLQPLVAILSGRGHVHGFTHTCLGATLIGLVGGATGKYAAQVALATVFEKRSTELAIPWRVALASGLVGSYSHVLLDGIMHRDLQPFAPWSEENPLLGLLSVGVLHEVCMVCGVVGVAIYWLRTRKKEDDAG